jgi:hypothetical protein
MAQSKEQLLDGLARINGIKESIHSPNSKERPKSK